MRELAILTQKRSSMLNTLLEVDYDITMEHNIILLQSNQLSSALDNGTAVIHRNSKYIEYVYRCHRLERIEITKSKGNAKRTIDNSRGSSEQQTV